MFPPLNYIPLGINVYIYWDNKRAKKRSYLCSVRQVGGHDRERESQEDNEGVGEWPEADHSEGNKNQ